MSPSSESLDFGIWFKGPEFTGIGGGMFWSFIGSGGGMASAGFSGIVWTIELGGINDILGLLKLFGNGGRGGPINGMLPIGPIGIVPGGIIGLGPDGPIIDPGGGILGPDLRLGGPF